MTPDELRRYAEMIVRGCIAFRRGDSLIEMVSLGHRDLAIAIAEAAYRAGALAVDVQYEDGRAYAAKIANAPRKALGHQTPWRVAQWKAIGTEPVAIVQVMGEYELDAVADLSPERVAADTGGRNRHVARIRREAKLRGTICAWPTEEWAARVYPEHRLARHDVVCDPAESDGCPRLVLKVQPPRRRTVEPTVRGDHDEALTVAQRTQRHDARPARPSTGGREQYDLESPNARADSAAASGVKNSVERTEIASREPDDQRTHDGKLAL